jgi:hypothetical protein
LMPLLLLLLLCQMPAQSSRSSSVRPTRLVRTSFLSLADNNNSDGGDGINDKKI